MTARYSWTPQIVAVVNWDAHGKALRRHLNKRTHLVKLVHGLLPTNAKLHGFDPRRSKCPSCQCIESWQHILRCQSASHVAWYKDMTQTLELRLGSLHFYFRLFANGVSTHQMRACINFILQIHRQPSDASSSNKTLSDGINFLWGVSVAIEVHRE